jgi:hypothetical protein
VEAQSAPAQAEAQGAEQAQEAPDAASDWQQSVDQQLSQAADGIRQMAEMNQTILSRLPEPAQEQEPDYEQQFAELFEQNQGYVEPGQMTELVRSQAESIAREMVAPLQEQLGQFQQSMTAQEFQALQDEFPELGDQRSADQLADAVVSEAMGLGLPQELADGLMQNPSYVRQVHLAMKAMSRAQGETPAGQGQQAPPIETGGGAAPAQASEGDEWDAFVQSRRPQGRVW